MTLYEWLDPMLDLARADPEFARLQEVAAERQAMWGPERSAELAFPAEFAAAGVTEAALDAAEAKLGAALPPSVRAFLQRFDGSHSASGRHRLLSLAEILAQATAEAPFTPWDGTPRPTRSDDATYTAAKPSHFLFVYRHALGEDGLCLDLRGDVEPRVVLYDPEQIEWTAEGYTLSRFATAGYTGFEALVAAHVYGWIVSALSDDARDAAKAILSGPITANGWHPPWRSRLRG